MPLTSPPTPSSPTSLSERLRADQQQIQRQLEQQTQQLLRQHAESLKKLSSDALRSTRSGMERHAAELETMHLTMAARIRWLLLWPLLATVSMAVLIGSVTVAWSMYRLDQIGDAQAALNQSSVNLAAQQQQQATQHQVPPLRKRR